MTSRNLIVILGPTASGKSALGVKLAKQFHGVILSADSRQVYRGMGIGTAKIAKREMRGVPHFLIDIASPKQIFTVAQFQQAAQRVLSSIPTTTPVFIVGGSPFYLEAIINPRPFPNVKPNPKLRQRWDKKSTAGLLSMLKKRDPRRAAGLDPYNRRRIIRALEIVHSLGRVPARRRALPLSTLKLGISPPRHELYRRIDQRIDQRVHGMLKEIRRLRRSGLSWKRLDSFGLEYRWIARILQRKISRHDGVARLKTDSHAFARRQLTWWQRDQTIRWIQNQRLAEALVRKFLKR